MSSTDDANWDDMELNIEADSTQTDQWQIDLDNKFTSATLEIKENQNLSIKLFLECIALEEANTNVIDKRFFALKQILLIQCDNITNNDDGILSYFEQLLKYYDPMHQRFVSTNDLSNTLRLLFNSLKSNHNIKLLLKLANCAKKYFESYDTDDEYTKSTIGFILKMLQNEYINKLDFEYKPNIKNCNHNAMYNAINDMNKIVIDTGNASAFDSIRMKHALNIHLTDKINNKLIFDVLFQCIKTKNEPQIYFYHRHNDETKENTSNDVYEMIQRMIWKNTMNVIPFYIYEHDFDAFYTKHYSFLCEKERNKKYIGYFDDYPNQIIDDKLFLGTIKHAMNDEILCNIKITQIVNVTKENYVNNITKTKGKYLQIAINDDSYERIDGYFESGHGFIESALSAEGNKVLVHCRAGVSRSATIVISYIMKLHKMCLADAFKFVKSKRSKIQPNGGFMEQLKTFEATNL